MKSSLRKAMTCFVGMLSALVISLGSLAFAAPAPVAVTLDPLSDGLLTPIRTALDSDGNVYVADPRAGGVVKLDKYGVAVARIAMPNAAKAVAVLGGANAIPGGRILVAQETAVSVLDENGVEVAKLGSGIGQFTKTGGIAVDSNGYIYVVDSAECFVKKFGADGSFLISFGGKGATSGLFQAPAGIAVVNEQGATVKIAVVDMVSGNVQFFSPSGSYLDTIGSAGDNPMTFRYPSGVAFEYLNGSVYRMYVVDMFQSRVQAIDPVAKTFLAFFGSYGDKRGSLMAPSDIVYDSVNKRLLIANGLSNVVSYGIGNTLADAGSNPVKPVAAPVTAPVQLASVTLAVNPFPALTAQATVTLSGTTDGTSVMVGSPVTGITAPAVVSGNTWSIVYPLYEGVNSIRVSASRVGANTVSQNIAISLDTAAPFLFVSALADKCSVSNPVQNISGMAVDPNLSVVRVNDQPVPVVDGRFSTAVTLVKGDNTITVVAEDVLGHVSAPDVRTIAFNPALPVLAVAAPADGMYTNVQDVVVSGTVDKAATVKVNGVAATSANGGLDWAASVRLVAGINTITVTAVDEYLSEVSEKRTVVFNDVRPTVVIASPAQDLATKLPSLNVSGTATSVVGVKDVKATVNGAEVPVTLNGNDFSFFAALTAEGSYAISVTVTDLTNNSSTASRTVVYDVTPPELAINTVTSPYPLSISGTVEAGAALTVKDQKGVTGKVTIVGTKWTADLSGVAYDPATLTVTAVDAAGNSSIKTLSAPVADGDMDGDGKVTIKDALEVIRIVTSNRKPTAEQLRHGDVGPLVKGQFTPDGKLEMIDAILILRKALDHDSKK